MKTLHTIYTNFAKRLVMLLIILITIGIGSAWGEDYELVTTITDGEYVIGAVKGSAGNNTTIYAINSTDGTSWKSATETTPSNGKISNPSSSIVWTLTKTGDNSFTLKNGSIYLTIATTTGSGSVRSNSTSPGTIYFASTGSNSTFEISGVSTFTVSSGNQVGYNIGSGYRQYAQRGHSTATSSGSISTQFRFYKKTASTFTVKCQSNNASYGAVSQPSVTNVANNTSISSNGNKLTIGSTIVTATPKEQDANYTYAFSNWSGIPAGGKVTADVTVTANFTRTARALTNYRTSCTTETVVTLDPNGGAGGTPSVTATKGEAMPTITPPTRTGYIFQGYFTAASDGTQYYNEDGTSAKDWDKTDETFTLYAQWECAAPTNVKITGEYIRFEGDDIVLTVSGDNIATDATYEWKKGDQVINNQTTATLTINNCTISDAGNYTCTVSNGICSASNNYTVKMYRLRGLTDPENNWTTDFVFSKAEGKTATYEITLNGDSNYKFKVHDGSAYYGNNEGGDNPNPTMTHDNCTNWTMQENKGYNVILQTTITGVYTFVLDYTDESNPTISVTYPSKQTIYFYPGTDYWVADNAKFTIYSWGGTDDATFTPMEDVDCGGIYSAEISTGYTSLIFIRYSDYVTSFDNYWNKTIDLVVPTDNKVMYDRTKPNSTHLFLVPNSKWNENNARFAAYFFDNGETWYSMYKLDAKIAENTWMCLKPTDKEYPKVIFCRMNPENTTNSWNTKWNQSGDLTIPTNGKNLLTVPSGSWDGFTTTWSTFYGDWTTYTPNHTVTFDTNGHGTAPEDQCITDGGKATNPGNLSATGYTFDGWYTDQACNNAWDFANDVVTSDITLYAKWTINTHTVTWKPAGGNWSGDANDKVVEYEYGEEILAPEKPTYDCHEFAEWEPTYTAGMTMPDEDLEFTATWNKLSYTITFQNYDGTVLQTSTVECDETPSYTGATPTREQTAQYTYTFKGWSPTIAPATQDQVYTAQFDEVTRSYTVTWMVGTTEYTAGTPTNQVEYDKKVTNLPTSPQDDAIGTCANKFMGWSTKSSGSNAENADYYDDLFTTAENSPAITDATTFYAVFATATTTPGTSTTTNKTYSHTITSQIWDATGAKTLSDVSWTLANNGGYYGYTETKGQQVGSGSYPAKSMTLTTSGFTSASKITSVTINTSGASSINANVSVKVGGTSYSRNTNTTSAISSTATDYTFTGNSTGEIVISWSQTSSKAIYFKSITVVYSNITTTPDVTTYSNYVTNCCALARATNLTVSGTTANSATLTWTAPSPTTGITKLQVQVRDENGIVKVDDLAADATTATITGLSECTEYTFCIASVGDCEVVSDIVTATPFSGAKTVNYDYNGGTGSPASFTTNCNNQTITLPVAIRPGYTFEGWYDPEGNKVGDAGAPYDPATSPITLYAQWTINKYTVTWNPNGGNWDGSTSNIVQTYEYGAAINKPDDPTRENGIFKGWTPEPTSTMPASDKTYTAQWDMVYTLTFVDMNAGGTTRTQTQQLSGESIVAPTADSEVCDMWTFIGWAPSNSLNGGTDKPADFIVAGETISGSQITSNATYYSVYSYNSDNTQEFEVGKSGTYLMYALSGTTKYYATTANSSGNAFYTNQENNFATYGYPSTFTLTYNSASKKYKIYHENTTEGKNSKGYLYQSNATDSEINVKSETSYTEFTISEGTAEGSFVISFPRTGKTDAYFGGSSSSNFSGKASSYDIYFEPASEIQYYNAANCGEVDTYTMSFHNPFGDENALIWYDAEHEESYYTDKPLNTSIDVFPTMVYNGWAFIGWTANQQYNELIGEDNLDDENSATDNPASSFTIYSNTTGWAYTLNSNVTMYPVFTKYEDNEDIDLGSGGEYYMYFYREDDYYKDDYFGSDNHYQRMYALAGGGDNGEFGYTTNCNNAQIFEFIKEGDGWNIRVKNADGTYPTKSYLVNTNGNDYDLVATKPSSTWSITKEAEGDFTMWYRGNTANSESDVYYQAKAREYSGGSSWNFKCYNQDNNASQYYYKVYLGTCENRVFSSNPTNKLTVTWNPNGGQWADGSTFKITQSYEEGDTFSAPETPTREGYTFAGWSDGENTYDANDTFTMPAEKVTYTAIWQINQCVVTWKVNAQEVAKTTVDIANQLTTIPYTPEDDELGCCAEKFIGWSTETNPTKNQVYTTASELQNLIGTLAANTTKTFHAVFATPVPGAGNSLVTFNEMGYGNEEAVASVTLGDGMGNGDAIITFNKGTAATYVPTYYNIGEAVRTYAGNTITVAATYANTVLTQIDFAFAKGENANAITASTGTITDGVWTGNAQSVTFTISGATGHRRIASIAITTSVTGDQYTNYVTKCDLSGSASIGAGTITYAVGNAIEVKCGQRSPASKAATLTFASAQDLTCPVTIEASAGFLVSTNKNDNSKYESNITVKPVKTGINKGKLPTIYVRAEANFGVSGQMNGTITASGDEITTTQVNVVANVTCTQYTLTVVDHLGNTISTTQYYEGDEVAEVDAPATDDCSKDYTFDGWSETSVEYGSLIYNKVSFPFTMPANDVTLYPVYVCSEDYHRVTEDLGADNWEGQYLIAHSNTEFANGYQGGTTDGNCIGGTNSVRDLSQYITNDVVSKDCDIRSVKLIAVNGGYVLQTRDGKYNYITAGAQSGLTANDNLSTADDHPLTIIFNSETDIAITNLANVNQASLQYSATYFRFYKPGNQNPVYLYKKYLYTTPLICGTIEAEDAVVTSTAGQTIKVNVPITITSTLGGTTNITAESDNDHFAVTPLENVATGEHTIAVHYTPDATTDGTESANITLTASHGNRATTTFQVTGRHLPENFVIAAKWGENWYVLPADMTSESITEGLLIEVDDPSDPTKALAAPNTTKYGLKSVYTTSGALDRYKAQGENIVFVENITGNNKTLYNAGGDAQNSTNTNIQVYAQYKTATGGYYETNPGRYEWIPTTTDLKDYTLTSAHTFATEAARTVSLDNHGIFGTLLQDKSYNGMVRLLPVDNFYEPIELQVVEWKQNSVSVMYTGAGSKYTTKVGNNAESSVQPLSKIDHVVYSLSTSDLTTATNQPLIIYIKDDANATIGSIKLTIPAIVATDKSSTELSVTAENAKATNIVILDGATLTAGTTKYTYNDVVVYPGGKLVIEQSGTLGMYTLTLRAGSSWGAAEYEHKYPQFLLKGDYSNSSGQINLDYVTTADYYYPLSVPEEVTIGDIKYPVDIYGSNVDKANTGSFQFKYYDGAQRVAQGSQYGTGWVVVDETKTQTLTPNQGYAIWGIPKKINGTRQTYGIHRIPIKKAASDLITNETTTEEIAITAHGDASTPPNDRGWNYLGNPYLAGLGTNDDTDVQMGLLVQEMIDGKWTGGWVNNGEQVRYVTLTNDCQNFEALPVSEATILPFTTFFVQAAQTGAIALNAPTAVAATASVVARRYAAQQETAKEITTGILLTGNDQTDRTGLLIADNFTEEYDYNADLSKFENSGINLYTIGKDGKLAFMAINQALAEQPIPVGYTAPAEGLYTIAFDEDRYNATDISALYLIDYDSNEKTNLLHTDYSFVTAAGTNNQRFALQVAFAPENATNVEWVGDATIQVGVEGNTLMLNNLPTDAAVHVFDALGRLMYHAPTVPTEMQLTLPTGYYLVRIADKQNAVVIKTVIP